MGLKSFSFILSGGQGTRLWPLSKRGQEKQYLPLIDGKSLLEDTFLRLKNLIPKENRYIVTTRDQKERAFDLAQQYMPKDNLVIEPEGRNTAPCIFLCLVELLSKKIPEDSLCLFLPSDHLTLDRDLFQETLKSAMDLAASSNNIVTVGIKPHCPHTGYGYIKRGSPTADDKNQKNGLSLSKIKTFDVDAFTEKPELSTAQKYLSSGDYYWNSGMFIGKLSVLLDHFNEYAPDIYEQKSALLDALLEQNTHSQKGLGDTYSKLPQISMDYAIIEKTSKISVVEGNYDWNDLGTWESICEVMKTDENHNAWPLMDDGKVKKIVSDTKNNIISTDKRVLALSGISDHIIIDRSDVLMILPKKEAQKVKEIVAELKKDKEFHNLL